METVSPKESVVNAQTAPLLYAPNKICEEDYVFQDYTFQRSLSNTLKLRF